ncbi:MAG TPA: archease [Methanothermococcus okinawensis]|uniref:Protein archease n=1 Tax=Methanothermococcus okinawensis TaxID=155863 RepID=A0A832ZKB6_9EURY|nr:archease [Methanococcaceae archaeon]HIP84686.1 archease [Methanothermococcus okinawensis]HIP91741.1 archease [Methanothermococcus okinawensis]
MYRYFGTTADMGVIAEGETLEEAFREAARALTNLMVDIDSVEKKIERKISVKSEDLYSLLYDFLTELLVIRDSENIVFSDFNIKIFRENDEYRLECIAYGEELDREKHKPKEEVKAITYHKMEIEKKNGKYVIRYIVDI